MIYLEIRTVGAIAPHCVAQFHGAVVALDVPAMEIGPSQRERSASTVSCDYIVDILGEARYRIPAGTRLRHSRFERAAGRHAVKSCGNTGFVLSAVGKGDLVVDPSLLGFSCNRSKGKKQ